MGLVFDHVVGTVEVINCKDVKIQVCVCVCDGCLQACFHANSISDGSVSLWACR